MEIHRAASGPESEEYCHNGDNDAEDVSGFRNNGEGPMFLVWKDVSVILPDGSASKWLLSGLSGFAEPGRITAIMGPSGSGLFLEGLWRVPF
uniref:Uncharacterized protein n=1 Tax=Kalanchoe fedtschenkoi TaxID=63787 RepID=A0A7N0U082_KALFE